MIKFDGNVLISIGLNNSLKALQRPFSDGNRRIMQDVPKYFKMLDDVLKKILPNAKRIVFGRPIASADRKWQTDNINQQVFMQVLEEVEKRDHALYHQDVALVDRLHNVDRDMVHMENDRGVTFWKSEIRNLFGEL